ncbi:ATP-binding protein [Deinococcus multiflagellatus]|uniref:histidine kinase n=1 Tax=Deinococcus multiflagellatus TaxID=1656887 RepID=A0ABW1ZH40_9DEIO
MPRDPQRARPPRPGGPASDGYRQRHSPEHLERIFERFYRVDPARTRGDGSGVGLTIARGLAHQMGGDLQVTSGPGGSTFTLTLPAAEGA